jgi:hypothetical protein
MMEESRLGEQFVLDFCIMSSLVKHSTSCDCVGWAEEQEMFDSLVVHIATWTNGGFDPLQPVEVSSQGYMS